MKKLYFLLHIALFLGACAQTPARNDLAECSSLNSKIIQPPITPNTNFLDRNLQAQKADQARALARKYHCLP